jgi:hypothetical protein
MISSIGSSTAYAFDSTAKPTAGRDAQIARYKKELSDCVNCESAKTVKGKANIQAITDKITALTAETEKAAKSSKGTNQESALSATLSANNVPRTGHPSNIAPVSDSGVQTIGNYLNVFA